jgi:hypothetical protein
MLQRQNALNPVKYEVFTSDLAKVKICLTKRHALHLLGFAKIAEELP